MEHHLFRDLIHNKIFIITLIVWAITQGIKVVLGVVQERRFDFKWFIGTGGMPSSHAAGATALATSCGLQEGFQSTIFALAAVFAIVTMFDAQGVRRAAGQQASILNQMIDDIYWKGKFESEKILEFLGHSPLQVLIGGFLGVILAIFLY